MLGRFAVGRQSQPMHPLRVSFIVEFPRTHRCKRRLDACLIDAASPLHANMDGPWHPDPNPNLPTPLMMSPNRNPKAGTRNLASLELGDVDLGP